MSGLNDVNIWLGRSIHTDVGAPPNMMKCAYIIMR